MSAPVWKGPGATGITFRPTTGKLTLSDRGILTDIYGGTKLNCDAAMVGRGTFGTGARTGWVVTSSVSEQSRGNEGTLTVNWEAGGASATIPLPTDEFSLQAMELFPRVERSPFFAALTIETIAMAFQTINAPTPMQMAMAEDNVAKLADSTQRTLGMNLVNKLKKGLETYYLVGWRYTWTAYSYTAPTITLGGSIQAPLGPLTGYFSGMDFIRLADGLQSSGVNGSSYKITRTWLGGPIGHWDTDLYP